MNDKEKDREKQKKEPTLGGSAPRQHYSAKKAPKSNESIVDIDTKERFRHAKEVALEGEHFLRRVTGAVVATAKDIARSEETGTIRQIENFDEARIIIKNSLMAARDVPRQVGNTVKVGQNAVVATENLVLKVLGKETKEYKHLVNARSLKIEEKSGLSDEDLKTSKQLDKKFAGKKDNRLNFEIERLKAENQVLDKQAAKLQAKGKDSEAQLASIQAAKEKNLQKIGNLEQLRDVREKAKEDYGDVAAIKKRSKLEKLRKRTEKKIKKAQYDSVGGKKEFRKIHKLDSRIDKEQKAFDQLRSKTRKLKDKIKELEKKGDLSPEEFMRLEKLKEQKAKNQNKLKGTAVHAKDAKEQRAQKGTVASRDSLLSETDQRKLSFLEESTKRKKLGDKMGKARTSRKELSRSAVRILSRASEQSEEVGVQGVSRASRFIQNRYVRETVKFYLKPFVSLSKFVAQKVDKAFGISKKITGVKDGISLAAANVGAKAKNTVIHSKPVTHVRNVYTERREKISEKLKEVENKASEKLKEAENKASEKLKEAENKATEAAKKTAEKIPEPIRDRARKASETASKGAKKVKEGAQKVGEAAKKTSEAAKAAAKAADEVTKAITGAVEAVKAFVMKFVLIASGVLLLIAVLGAVLTSIGGAAQEIPLLGSLLGGSSEDSPVDDTDLTPIITEQMLPIQQSWEKDVNDFLRENVKKYDNVYVGFEEEAQNTEKENFLRIILMAAMSAQLISEEVDQEEAYENFYSALRHLFEQVYGYELQEGDVTMCTGCRTDLVKCDGCKTTEPTLCDGCETQIRHCEGCETVVTNCDGCMINITYCEGCVVANETETGEHTESGTEETTESETDTLTCPGHEEKYCPGHTTLQCPGHEETFCPGHTEIYCPGNHRKVYCPGHQEATLVITATSPKELYEMENQNMKSPSPGFQYSSDFEGWTDENIEQLNYIMESAEDLYKGLDLLDGIVVFKDYRT